MILKKVAVLLASLLLLSSCAATEPDPLSTLSQYETQELKWRDCYGNYQCSSLLVPINYAELSVGAFSLSLLRYQALDQERRIGSLVVNPGGPGSSGDEIAWFITSRMARRASFACSNAAERTEAGIPSSFVSN